MAEQKLNLFEFASTSMADVRATATKIVRCQIAYAGQLGATFDRIPDYVGCHPSVLSRSILQNPSEHFPIVHARMAEPDIYKSLAPVRHRHRSNPSALALQIDNGPVALPQLQLIQSMVASEELGPKSTNEYIKLVKMIVASAKDPKTRKQSYPVFWDSEYLDLPIVEKRNQKRPAFDSETVTRLVGSAKRYVQMVYVLTATSGMRIGEVLGLEIDKHFADDFSTVLVRQKVRKCKMEDYLKTDNAYRDIDLHSSVVMMLKEFIGLRTVGFLFASRNGKPLSNSNILNRHLHPTLDKLGWSDPRTGDDTAGNHAFRRFRNTFLRKNHVPRSDSILARSRREEHDGRLFGGQRRAEVPQNGRGTSGDWI
jgi:hypothetical protein